MKPNHGNIAHGQASVNMYQAECLQAKFITPFIGDQVEICNAFGFNIPEGCAPMYMSKKKGEKKRGRPRKTTDVVKLD